MGYTAASKVLSSKHAFVNNPVNVSHATYTIMRMCCHQCIGLPTCRTGEHHTSHVCTAYHQIDLDVNKTAQQACICHARSCTLQRLVDISPTIWCISVKATSHRHFMRAKLSHEGTAPDQALWSAPNRASTSRK